LIDEINVSVVGLKTFAEIVPRWVDEWVGLMGWMHGWIGWACTYRDVSYHMMIEDND
jgi:hypothetical protein